MAGAFKPARYGRSNVIEVGPQKFMGFLKPGIGQTWRLVLVSSKSSRNLITRGIF